MGILDKIPTTIRTKNIVNSLPTIRDLGYCLGRACYGEVCTRDDVVIAEHTACVVAAVVAMT